LVLTLKRFAYDADLGRQHKRSHPVDIPTLINIGALRDALAFLLGCPPCSWLM
jgi:hypothetical protein